MMNVNTRITIGKYAFPFCVNAEVESSWEMLTDTAKIDIPRKLSFQGKSIAQGDSLFKRGDAVTISMGYNGRLTNIFTGFVSGIKAKIPMEFACEDAMWLLKQYNFVKSYGSVSLQQLLLDLCQLPYQAVDVNLGQFRINKASLAKTLEEIQKTYNLYSFIRNGKLYSGKPYWPDLQSFHTFRFGWDIIEDDLEYLRKDDVRIKVKAISMKPDNTKVEIELGDDDGEQRTLTFYNMDEATLKSTAEKEMEKLRYEGFRGTFTTFGEPIVRHGDVVTIRDKYHAGRDGSYLVKKVVYKLGVGGLRQTITLDSKYSAN